MILAASEPRQGGPEADPEEQDPSQLVAYTQLDLAGITLIENITQYKYIEMGQNTFMTLQIANHNNMATAKKRRRDASAGDQGGGAMDASGQKS